MAFLAAHPCLTFLGLVLTDACKEPVFRDHNHPDHVQTLATSGELTNQSE